MMERLPATVEHLSPNPSLSRDESFLQSATSSSSNWKKDKRTRILRALQEHLIRLFGRAAGW